MRSATRSSLIFLSRFLCQWLQMTSCESVVLIQNVCFFLQHLQNKHNLRKKKGWPCALMLGYSEPLNKAETEKGF